jgi:predicted nuclease of predicted toxin-antitoxin system
VNRLFIHLYLDEDVDVLVADLLRSRGFDATTTLDAARTGSGDEEQLLYATEHEMALLTHNRVHFEDIATRYWQTGQTHAGIFIATRHPPPQIAGRLLILLNQITADEMKNQLLYL